MKPMRGSTSAWPWPCHGSSPSRSSGSLCSRSNTCPRSNSAPRVRDEFHCSNVTSALETEVGVQPRILRQFRAALNEKCKGNLSRLNQEMGTTYRTWDEITVPEVEMASRGNKHTGGALETWFRREFRPRVPLHEFWPLH